MLTYVLRRNAFAGRFSLTPGHTSSRNTECPAPLHLRPCLLIGGGPAVGARQNVT